MNIPRHILIIPDGNRRWARAKNKPAHMGHLEGVRITGAILKETLNLGVTTITIWGASEKNLTKRSRQEVAFLGKIFKIYFTKLLKESDLEKYDVRIRALGKWKELLPQSVSATVQKCIDTTKTHKTRSLTFLLGYNGKDEMRNAIADIAAEKLKNPKIKIREDDIKKYLWTKDLPPVDLVIRTGGEPHLSTGVMMWDIADARFYFTETFWPAFTPKELRKAVDEYSRLEKRDGA
ncbi:MAG: polyprenyl diphosphate synthase [Patescibacteria group bacterium]|nr:polyprenyl diphosphate synthase [Patescibacteria group bacterium]